MARDGSRDEVGQWSYWRAAEAEFAFWPGGMAPDLKPHFHDETQLTLVLAGERRFTLGRTDFAVRAGECIVIPAGMPHRSLPADLSAARCLNVYAPFLADEPAVFVVPEALDAASEAGMALLGGIVAGRARPRRLDVGEPAWAGGAGLLSRPMTIGRIAAARGISREEFSRRFARKAGLPPHAYRIVLRLNEARRRLREAAPIAGLAADLGFADQSHFGRQFRRVFGVTPAAYRAGLPPSQMIQTTVPS